MQKFAIALINKFTFALALNIFYTSFSFGQITI